MNESMINWDYCQRNSDDILASGLSSIKSRSTHEGNINIPSAAGNYLILADGTPVYSGEAGNLLKRLKQQFNERTSTFYKNYVKKQSQLKIGQNLQIEDFDIKYIETAIGRKEMEEFGIVNFPTPLNKFQKGKRDIYQSSVQENLWNEVQSEYSEIIEEGAKTVLSIQPVNWQEATPIAKAGLYIISNSNDETIYVGESSNIGKRYGSHGKDTYFSAFRRNLGTKLLGFQLKEKNGKKRYFDSTEEAEIDLYIRSCKITMHVVNFGRFELEEYLIKKIQPVLNKRSK